VDGDEQYNVWGTVSFLNIALLAACLGCLKVASFDDIAESCELFPALMKQSI
jgi:hypothetical protein